MIFNQRMGSEEIKKYQTRITELFLSKDDFLQMEIRANEDFNINDCHELINAAKEIGNGRKFYNLIIVGEHTLADNEARTLSCSALGSIYKLADAFVISSLSQRIIANFYMKVNKPFVPTKFFNKVEEAIAWLKELRSEGIHG